MNLTSNPTVQVGTLAPYPYKATHKGGMDAGDRERSLQAIGDIVEQWIGWTQRKHETEGMEIPPDTHVILGYENAPPVWPNVGQLTRWLEVLRG